MILQFKISIFFYFFSKAIFQLTSTKQEWDSNSKIILLSLIEKKTEDGIGFSKQLKASIKPASPGSNLDMAEKAPNPSMLPVGPRLGP